MKLKRIISVLISLGIILSGVSSFAQNMPFSDIENYKGEEHIRLLYSRGIVKGREDGLFHTEDLITGFEFVAMLLRDRFGEIPPNDDNWWSGYIDFALKEGVIEDFDNENAQNPITRQSASRIIHETLAKVYNEQDEEWSSAEKLSDLYSCHTCVMHIAQVYVKGIMEAEGNVFNLEGNITRGEAAMFIARIIDPSLRCDVGDVQTSNEVIAITYDEVKNTLSNNSTAWLIDVREADERAEGYLQNSISVPLSEIINGTAALPEDKNVVIIVYCKSGARSKKACEILLEQGYTNVCDLGAMPN